jgi:hypothetical protein
LKSSSLSAQRQMSYTTRKSMYVWLHRFDDLAISDPNESSTVRFSSHGLSFPLIAFYLSISSSSSSESLLHWPRSLLLLLLESQRSPLTRLRTLLLKNFLEVLSPQRTR